MHADRPGSPTHASPPVSALAPRRTLLPRAAACLVVGAGGGLVVANAADLSAGKLVLLGALYGLVFTLLAASRAVSAGAGLLWGLGYAYLLWLVGPAGLFALGH